MEKRNFKKRYGYTLLACIVIIFILFQVILYYSEAISEEKIINRIYVNLNPNKQINDLNKDKVISIDSSKSLNNYNDHIIQSHNSELISWLKLRIELSNNWNISYMETMRHAQNIYIIVLVAFLTFLFTKEYKNKTPILKIALLIIIIMFSLEVHHQFQYYKKRTQEIKTRTSIIHMVNREPNDRNWYILSKDTSNENPSGCKTICQRYWLKFKIALFFEWNRFIYYEIPVVFILFWIQYAKNNRKIQKTVVYQRRIFTRIKQKNRYL